MPAPTAALAKAEISTMRSACSATALELTALPFPCSVPPLPICTPTSMPAPTAALAKAEISTMRSACSATALELLKLDARGSRGEGGEGDAEQGEGGRGRQAVEASPARGGGGGRGASRSHQERNDDEQQERQQQQAPAVLSASAVAQMLCAATLQLCAATLQLCTATSQLCAATLQLCAATLQLCTATSQLCAATSQLCAATSQLCAATSQLCAATLQHAHCCVPHLALTLFPSFRARLLSMPSPPHPIPTYLSPPHPPVLSALSLGAQLQSNQFMGHKLMSIAQQMDWLNEDVDGNLASIAQQMDWLLSRLASHLAPPCAVLSSDFHALPWCSAAEQRGCGGKLASIAQQMDRLLSRLASDLAPPCAVLWTGHLVDSKSPQPPPVLSRGAQLCSNEDVEGKLASIAQKMDRLLLRLEQAGQAHSTGSSNPPASSLASRAEGQGGRTAEGGPQGQQGSSGHAAQNGGVFVPLGQDGDKAGREGVGGGSGLQRDVSAVAEQQRHMTRQIQSLCTLLQEAQQQPSTPPRTSYWPAAFSFATLSSTSSNTSYNSTTSNSSANSSSTANGQWVASALVAVAVGAASFAGTSMLLARRAGS
ncbi:unnamed protein product [Closterium sp. NIES-53]